MAPARYHPILNLLAVSLSNPARGYRLTQSLARNHHQNRHLTLNSVRGHWSRPHLVSANCHPGPKAELRIVPA